MDYEHTDLGDAWMAAAEDKRLVAAENAPIAAAETDSAHASPPPATWSMDLPHFTGQDSYFPALAHHFGARRGDYGGTPGA